MMDIVKGILAVLGVGIIGVVLWAGFRRRNCPRCGSADTASTTHELFSPIYCNDCHRISE